MTSMKKAAVAVRGAFKASLELKAALAALGAKAAHSDTFRLQAAKLVAEDANRYYHLKGDKIIHAYKGQRGVTFGVVKEIKDDGTPKYELTDKADATRKWFNRNVEGKKSKPKARKLGAWKAVVEVMHDFTKLRKELEASKQRALAKALEAVYARFSG